jgi:hypothetical protein
MHAIASKIGMRFIYAFYEGRGALQLRIAG